MTTPLHAIAIDLISGASQTLPDRLGRALHAQVMAWLGHGDAALAEAIHATDLMPFSLSLPQGPGQHLEPGDRLTLTVGLLSGEVVQPLLHGLATWDTRPCVLAELDFQLEGVSAVPGDRPQVIATSYEELAAQESLGKDVALQFCAPTSFKQQHGIQVFPLPELVFGGLERRWNHFAPAAVQLPPTDWTGWVAAYNLKTVVWPGKAGVEIGAVGWARYRFAEESVQQAASTLARFAEFAGVGRKTAQGFGRTQLRLEAEAGARGAKQRKPEESSSRSRPKLKPRPH